MDIGVQMQAAKNLGQQNVSHRTEQAEQRHDRDNQRPLRGRFPVWFDGGVEDLDHGSGFSLIEPGSFILFRQQLEDGLGVLHVAQFADILQAGFRHVADRHTAGEPEHCPGRRFAFP